MRRRFEVTHAGHTHITNAPEVVSYAHCKIIESASQMRKDMRTEIVCGPLVSEGVKELAARSLKEPVALYSCDSLVL